MGSFMVSASCGTEGAGDSTCCEDLSPWGEVRVESNPRSTLSAMVEATTASPVQVAVEFTDSMGLVRRTDWTDLGVTHELVVVGMRASESYELELVARASVEGADVEVGRTSRIFETGALPPDTRLPVSADVANGAYRSHYTLVGPGRRPSLEPGGGHG